MPPTVKEITTRFIDRYADDSSCAELLQFFARYPYTQFNRLAIMHTLDIQHRQKMKEALARLMDDKLVSSVNRDNLTLYFLSKEAVLP